MEAKYALRGDVVVVELRGRLDFESAEPFRKACLERLVREKVVFDLKDLNFVGSLGLQDFVDTLGNMVQKTQYGVRFCGVSPEFRRLFDAKGLNTFDIFENQEKAIQSLGSGSSV